MGLNLSIVHKITSIADLEHLTQALKETMTLQAQIQLKDDIRRLVDKKRALRIEIKALEMEKHGLQPPTEEDKEIAKKEDAEDEPQIESSTLADDSRRLIEELTEEAPEVLEEPQDVEGNTDLPLA